LAEKAILQYCHISRHHWKKKYIVVLFRSLTVSSGRLLWADGDTDLFVGSRHGDTDLFVGSRHGNTYYFRQNEMTSSWPMFMPAAGTLLGFAPINQRSISFASGDTVVRHSLRKNEKSGP
jgi:hypothetical protein